MSKLKELLTVVRDRKVISNNCKYPSALELIRCGIGANYGGKYYEEVLGAVLKPIIDEINKEEEL